MTASDPHQLRPDHLPTPFTADEIRAGCQPGRTLRTRVVRAGQEPFVHVTRFVSADAEGAEQESWEETPDGTRLREPQRRRSTWLGFQEHASFPAATTEVAEEEIEIPAGRFACVRYTSRDGESVSTFWFARTLPGMPLRFEERVHDVVMFSSTVHREHPRPRALTSRSSEDAIPLQLDPGRAISATDHPARMVALRRAPSSCAAAT